jgi:hypothetical protein
LKVVHDRYEGEAAQLGAKLILLRPDHYVAWTGDATPADPAALMRKVAGA